MTWIPCPKIDKFSYFYYPSPFERYIIFILKQIMKQVQLVGLQKKTQSCIQDHRDS